MPRDKEKKKEYDRKYGQENKEKRRARQKRYYKKNRERRLARQKEYYSRYYQKNKEKINENRKLHYQKNKDKIQTYQKEYHQKNKEKRPSYQRKYTYNLIQEQYDALLQEQEGKCAICKEVFIKTPCVDHCHETGRIRGILCKKCNTALGYIEDEIFHENALQYLQRKGAKE